jgi:protein TonB
MPADTGGESSVQTFPRDAPIAERLGSTLFVAALVHGVVILGVTFTARQLDKAQPLPSLNVTLIAPSRDDQAAPEHSDFIAQRNQRGAGSAAEGIRATTALAADHPVTQLGDPTGADLVDGTPREQTPSAEQISSRASSSEQVAAVPQPTDDPAAVPQRAAALVSNDAPQTLALELDVRTQLPKSYDRTLVATPSTQESVLAEYLDTWRRRVERIGTTHFPTQFLDNRELGRPTLEVTIASDGRLEDIVVRRSSGDKALDQAALRILRLAAPFDALPDHLRGQYDRLSFAYEWDFFSGVRPESTDDAAPKAAASE